MPPSFLRQKKAPPLVIGWREDVTLPALGLGKLAAKIDTGAKSAALHATLIHQVESDVVFIVTLKGRHHNCRLPLKEWRRVRSSNGLAETRAVVETEVRIGTHRFDIEVTLTDRTDMGVPMLLGRSSIAGRFLVHPGRSHLIAPRTRKAK